MSGQAVYSPAIYPSSSRIWKRCGYVETHRLLIMERSMSAPTARPKTAITESEEPDWEAITTIDRAAFEGFWGMSREGLEEALASTRRSAVLTHPETAPVAYALVGSQWGVAYLQRIAVHPEHRGRSLGSELMRAAIAWGRRDGSRTMVLNVRGGNETAQRLYRKIGFVDTGTALRLYRFEPPPMLGR